jgi:alpha-amylase
LSRVSFALVIHSHQPEGNFDHVIEEAYQKSYLPFVQVLARHPSIRLSLHYSGILLGWMETHHPEFFQQLRELIKRSQIEMVGGGYHEPILPVIPDSDKETQLRKLTDYLRRHFGVRPRGAWIAERVWEPSLALPLAEAGVEYVVLDDTHFLAAGLEPWQLGRHFITEEAGASLQLVPSLKSLRYAIPFLPPEETLRILHQGIGHYGSLFAMGDDCEKFGVWPGTYEHCYTKGWLENFFAAIENAQEWLQTTTVSDFLAAYPPVGIVYLPTASYAEMMEWALPTAASAEFKTCLQETEQAPAYGRLRRFMHGGMWRNFLSKYPEANQIHKLMLRVSRRLNEARLAVVARTEENRLLEEAQRHLLAGQCNDAYWHGVFGGLYAPHLRSALLRHLIEAESLLDRLDGVSPRARVRVTHEDYDADGREEILVEHPLFGMVVRPAEGATVSSLRFKPAKAELINSVMRRPEPYHDLVRRHVTSREGPKEGPASIHDLALSKEQNLDALLRYDRYLRSAFRTYLFPSVKQWEDFKFLSLDEHRDLAGGPWMPVGSTSTGTLEMRRETLARASDCEMKLVAAKTIKTKASAGTWRLECKTTLSTAQACRLPLALGVELVINLLAADAPDRYISANGTRYPLNFQGELGSADLVLVDEWQRVKISLTAQPQPRWWIVPIETISQSEAGFERIYQGSAILAVWMIGTSAWNEISGTVTAEIAALD